MFDDSKVSYRIFAEQDDLPVRGNAMCSGDDDFDRQVEDAILARLDDGDVWAWASVKVEARYEGVDTFNDEDIVGVDYLGACNYKDEEDFKRCPYYEDMCSEARDDLYAQIEGILARFGCINPADEPELHFGTNMELAS